MRTRIPAAAPAACIPAAVFAQGKGARSSDTASSSSSRASCAPSSARSPTSHDLADLNPAALLISKRKKAATNLLAQQDGDLEQLIGGRP
jgi:hypothetical protein